MRRGDLVVSSDLDDLQSIAAAAGHRLQIDHPRIPERRSRTERRSERACQSSKTDQQIELRRA